MIFFSVEHFLCSCDLLRLENHLLFPKYITNISLSSSLSLSFSFSFFLFLSTSFCLSLTYSLYTLTVFLSLSFSLFYLFSISHTHTHKQTGALVAELTLIKKKLAFLNLGIFKSYEFSFRCFRGSREVANLT